MTQQCPIQMDQRGLDLHGFVHHDHQSLHEQHFNPGTRPPNKISLRSMSKSDPHLNVPHLLLSQDEEHPSLNKIFSSLIHADAGLRSVHHLSAETGMPISNNGSALRPSESSSNLLREDALSTLPTLRKSSSAVNWSSLAGADSNKGLKESSNWSGYDQQQLSSHNTDYLQGLVFSRQHDHSEGGLVMSSSSDSKMSVIAPTIPAQNPFSQALGSSSSAVQLGGVPGNPLDPHAGDHDRKGHGVFGNMFRQGFFSRPVVRSEEEQYRYLMALDR